MIEPECHLWGNDFHPSDLNTIDNIQLRVVNEPGGIGTIGKYKDKPLPYGACSVCTPDIISIPDRITWMADFIRINKKRFIDAGATDITFWIYWYGVQGNMEFTPEELCKLSELNIKLCIDYIQQGEEDNL